MRAGVIHYGSNTLGLLLLRQMIYFFSVYRDKLQTLRTIEWTSVSHSGVVDLDGSNHDATSILVRGG